jgi:UDP-2-acetamido-3-amino-2,3-dideoxy-glucuronate N-acetyltransferase
MNTTLEAHQTVFVSPDVVLGENVLLTKFINLYGCTIGSNTKIGPFVEIQKNAVVGQNCKISSHTFICDGVTIGDNCFIGHGVMFINDNRPQATNPDGSLETEDQWKSRFSTTKVGNNVAIGTNATILGGVTIGDNSLIGAGSVVTKNVPPNQIWAGNPAVYLRDMETSS